MSAPEGSGHWAGRSVTVTGGAGFVGRRVVAALERAGARVRIVRSSEHDLRERGPALRALEGSEVVFHLAATVGGIEFNRRYPARVAYDNLAMAVQVFDACNELGVEKLVAASSVCAYPKHIDVPFQESELWEGYPEETNGPYGVAKRILLTLSEAYRRQHGLNSCAPLMANLYGPGEDFDLENSHVIAGMIRKFVEAGERGDPTVTLWGTGNPSREFLYVDDAAEALLLAGERLNSSEPVNFGTGVETRISDLARLISELTGYQGEIVWDTSRPDGQPSRRLDVSRAEELVGFRATTPLEDGLRAMIASFRDAERAQASGV